MTWFNNDNVASSNANDDERVVRFRVPVGESKEFTFLDAAVIDLTIDGELVKDVPTPVRLSEYRVTIPQNLLSTLSEQNAKQASLLLERLGYRAGGWSNFATVPSEGADPLRDMERPASIVVYTVIDHSTWTSPQGKTYKDQKRLFVAKRNSPAWGILQKQIERLAKKGIESLRGCRFEASRHGDKTPQVGNSFDFIERVEDLESLPLPFDYGKVLAPKDPNDLKRLLGFIHGDASSQPEDKASRGGWGVADDDDVPF